MRRGRRRIRFRVASRFAVIRLIVLFGILLISAGVLYGATVWMPGHSYRGQLLPLSSEGLELQRLLKRDVQTIATIGARNVGAYDSLNATKDFLESVFVDAGYRVKQQAYTIQDKTYYNLEAEKLGTTKPEEIIVVGAHYDSAFTSIGANDNGTGAAAVAELARLFAQKSPQRTIRFVEFTNEEPPFFWTEDMGSVVYAQQLEKSQAKVVGMLSLETMGYFSEEAGSQDYPFPLSAFYPKRGNFIGFIGNLGSGNLVRRSIASFRRHGRFPSQGAALPGGLPGVGLSDHWAFWQSGYPGIMVTDTAPYRYPHYHTIDDTFEQIDFDKLTRVVLGLADEISDLAQ